jgi:hypothetical protein
LLGDWLLQGWRSPLEVVSHPLAVRV